MSMTTLVLANQKGGVGKSAIGTQFAYHCASRGVRVLFVDLDHQQNSSNALEKNPRVKLASITATKVLAGETPAFPSDATIVLVKGDKESGALERQPNRHNEIVNNFKRFLDSQASNFDLCIVDTNPTPDIRYATAMVTGQHLLSPIELNQEAIDGIGDLLTHARYGYHRVKATINPSLSLVGILPNKVQPTPFQKANFAQLAGAHANLLIKLQGGAGLPFAYVPLRSIIAESQASGSFIADVKKTAAREAWLEIKPSFDAIGARIGLEAFHGA